jgi:hypothetical protein
MVPVVPVLQVGSQSLGRRTIFLGGPIVSTQALASMFTGIRNWLVKPVTLRPQGVVLERSARHSSFSIPLISSQTIEERPIADSDFFRHFLSMERKRSERAGSPFVLAILRVKELPPNQDERRMLATLQRAIFSRIRDTDFVGWYDEDDEPTLGILFTEISGQPDVTVPAILKRLEKSISIHTAEDLPQTEVTCDVFQGKKSANYRHPLEPGAAACD